MGFIQCRPFTAIHSAVARQCHHNTFKHWASKSENANASLPFHCTSILHFGTRAHSLGIVVVHALNAISVSSSWAHSQIVWIIVSLIFSDWSDQQLSIWWYSHSVPIVQYGDARYAMMHARMLVAGQRWPTVANGKLIPIINGVTMNWPATAIHTHSNTPWVSIRNASNVAVFLAKCN